MSTVKADNFTWKTGEATAQVGSSVTGPQIVYGVAKSWINFNGSSPSTRASFNMSSVTKNGTSDFNINFTNSLLDVNYACACMFGNAQGYFSRSYDDGTPRTVLSFRISCFNLNGTGQDPAYGQITIDR